jgi:phosphotransferase system enzyme I (PtsI)
VSPEWCDGIGLVRTEFLFGWDHQLPDEETQYQGYRRIMEWAAGRPVVMRTLDVGGDKPVAGLVHEAETNPFLGKRGVRKTLAHPEVFKTQLRALARAASHGDLCIMVPMITLPEELARVRELYEEATRDLSTRGLSWRSSRIGMMVEVPAAALALNHFETEFLSIGSNDLLQYLTACARDNSAVAGLGKPTHPGFIRLLTSIAEQAADMNIRIGICGDMAADPDHIPLLLDCGLRSVSVPPEALARTKTAIRKYGSRGGGDGG